MMTVSIFMNTYLVPDVPTDFAFEAWKEKVVHEAAGDDDDGQQRHVVVEQFDERQSQRACVGRINSLYHPKHIEINELQVERQCTKSNRPWNRIESHANRC